ncbi:MAG TPA: tetratricopeptide repeat protein [Tepidisphaeraceae bacterium]|nr:tetratricopeptide repeat protein [Tepidisphaeraceae bacterium]
MAFRPVLLLPLVIIIAIVAAARGQSLDDAQRLLRTGEYAKCDQICDAAIAGNDWRESWWLLKLRAELTTGQYGEALKTYESALARQPASVQIRLLGYQVLRANDRPADAISAINEIAQMIRAEPWRYSSARDRVAVGRAMLIAGSDARQILELLYDRAKKDEPEAIEPYLASGDLALDKNDFAVAAESFEAAAKHATNDPDVYFGLARAYENDSQRANAALTKALELNPRHVPSLLYQADNAIDQEAYDAASEILDRVLSINLHESHAWAYRAVLAHLLGDRKKESDARDQALSTWHTNPEVDHLIGKKISQKYRFVEGQAYQRRALEFAPDDQPARIQLCQDLLRLGQEDEGWQLAADVFKADPYNVLAFNLITLHDTMAKYSVLTSGGFDVRMEPHEAAVYGQRVQALLARARQTLCEKYDVQLPETIQVEIFPQLKDFAIRTFGLPGGAGYLGVCFGQVITANSPASRPGHPANWEAILWHEFCHVVTLNRTRNKMPRWLSEGISVYEETQANPAWGQTMNPQYRELILEKPEAVTPVSKLSGAFLKPPGAMELQFAYYESSMVVRYIVDHFGLSAIKQILSDLADDAPINDALARHTEPIEKLDRDFADWLQAQAKALAPDVDWERPDVALDAGSAALLAWVDQHPKSFFGQLAIGQALVAEQKWSDAKTHLERAVALYPTYGEVGGPYVLLAAVYRGFNDVPAERAMLEKHASLNTDAVEPRLRLLEILEQQKDWPAVRKMAEQVLAVNPLIPAPHRYLADAAEAQGDRAVAIEANRTLLTMDPPDLADRHYHLAKLLRANGQSADARREVVRALEEAPRFREAHRLLLEIVESSPTTASTTAPARP